MFYKISEQHLQDILSILADCRSNLTYLQMSNVLANLRNLEKIELPKEREGQDVSLDASQII